MFGNSIKTSRIAEILVNKSEIENEQIRNIVKRIEFVGKDKPDKVLSFLTGTVNEDEYSSEENIIGGFGEMAMYYTNGDEKVAVNIVLASPLGETYDEEYLKHLIVDEWKNMGASTFEETVGSIQQ